MLRQATQNLITALYPRLSHEMNCKARVIPYRTKKGYSKPTQNRTALPILRWYTDDGFSGANFQRPGFQAMLADIEAGESGYGHRQGHEPV